MTRRGLIPVACWLLSFAIAGCSLTAHQLATQVILPEQTELPIRDPSQLPPAPLPPLPPPRTVTDTQPQTGEWRISLDQAIRIALKNASVVRILTGISAESSGKTIYDAAITNTAVDQAQARFDPFFDWQNRWNHVETPQSLADLLDPGRSTIVGSILDDYRSQVGLRKTNVLGGEWDVTWIENPQRFGSSIPNTVFPLNPQNRDSLTLSYSHPLLQGGGYLVNTAPIVLARIDTERSFFQYKDSVQELVRGVIQAYWNLVQSRVEVWARQIQVDTAKEQLDREQARASVGIIPRSEAALAQVTLNQFRAQLVAAKANVLAREGALRNIMGLPPSDHLELVPDSAPTDKRYKAEWNNLLELIEQRRPDVVELKLILEADQVRLIQAENQALPRLDVQSLYRWNGLSGQVPNGERLSTNLGEYTDWTIAVNFSVPLFLRDGRAKVRQQSLLIARDRANLEQGLHQAAHEVAITVREIDSTYEQYLAFKETRAAALVNLRAQIEQLNTGRLIFLNVLQALNSWGDAVSFEAQQLIAYNVALATLERQSGTILETHGLVFAEERFRAAGPFGCLGHGRDYPAALPVEGSPTLYPPTAEPGENAFDLKKPELRRRREKDTEKLPTLPSPRREPPSTLPTPRPIMPDDGLAPR